MKILAEIIDNSRVCSESHDARAVIWLSVLEELSRRGHKIYAMVKRGIELKNHPSFIKYDKSIDSEIDFYIGHCVYSKSKDRYKYFKNKKVPLVTYEAGWLYRSLLIDRNKLFGDSYYYNSIKDLINDGFDENQAHEFRLSLIAQKKSKWPQNIVQDIPKIPYIFLPGQVLYDLSIVEYSPIGLKDFINGVIKFAKKNKLNVIYKPHPGAADSELSQGKKELQAFASVVKKNNKHFYIVNANIYDLMQKSIFTACVNSGTMIDNFVTQTPVYACGKSIFSTCGGIVHDEKLELGLQRMLDKDYDFDKMKRQQLKLLWWLKNTLMQEHLSVEDNIRRLEYHTGVSFE